MCPDIRRDTQKPIGVSSFQLTESLPEKLQGSLPTIEELEAELSEPPTAEGNDRASDQSKEEL